MVRIILKPGRERAVKHGHPWLFSGAIKSVEGMEDNGEIAEVYSTNQEFLGRGFYNQKQTIAVRFLTFKDEPINNDFFRQRIQAAYNFRKQFVESANTNAYRLVHGEGDFLPGLTVDKYADYLVLQSSTAGIDRQQEVLLNLLQELCRPRGIYVKNNIPSRKAEGLQLNEGVLRGEIPEQLEIKENGFKFLVNIVKGQKTGFYLDQRENRRRVQELSTGRRVLNAFCYTGGFSVYAAAAARTTFNLDISAEALELAKQNFSLNSLMNENQFFKAGDCFDLLRELQAEKKEFDLIILDPPAFAKNQQSVPQAARGYKDINLQALKLLTDGGILVSCSCSQHISLELFKKILSGAANDAGRNLQVLEVRGQGIDHPVSAAHPEGEYLKCLICRAI